MINIPIISIFKNSLFRKIFTILFISISLVLLIFAMQAVNLQKNSLIDSLRLEAKSICDEVIFYNKENIVIDDQINILEQSYDYVQENSKILRLIIAKTNTDAIKIEQNKWSIIEEHQHSEKEYNQKLQKHDIIVNKEGKKVFYYEYPIQLSLIHKGWIYLSLSLKEYDTRLEAVNNQLLFLAMILFVVVILISYFIAKTFSKPIIKLNEASKQIAQGNLSLRVDIDSNDEIGKLAKTFNTMLNNLEYSKKELIKSHNELEYSVKLRTQELVDVNIQLQSKSIQLKELNENLEHKVEEAVKKQQDQEQILIQQSRSAAMGEMIGNIAHQWRQPLNILGLIIQNINFSYQINELSDEFMNNAVTKANTLTNNMSKTIDDFRNFFQPNKEKKSFLLNEIVKKSLILVESPFSYHNIKLIEKIEKTKNVYGFPNEFSQALINILNNAKDALVEHNIDDSTVIVSVFNDHKFGYVTIQDNAKGIKKNIISKIFDPYFTTKKDEKGTGIGLYMSKIIIEQNMQGKLNVKNSSNGVLFTIKIPLDKGYNIC